MSMRVFQKVVDEGGFAAAARALDMSSAGVTRQIADLEMRRRVYESAPSQRPMVEAGIQAELAARERNLRVREPSGSRGSGF